MCTMSRVWLGAPSSPGAIQSPQRSQPVSCSSGMSLLLSPGPCSGTRATSTAKSTKQRLGSGRGGWGRVTEQPQLPEQGQEGSPSTPPTQDSTEGTPWAPPALERTEPEPSPGHGKTGREVGDCLLLADFFS